MPDAYIFNLQLHEKKLVFNTQKETFMLPNLMFMLPKIGVCNIKKVAFKKPEKVGFKCQKRHLFF